MSSQRIKIPRTSDRSINKFFKALGKQHEVKDAQVTALAFSTIGQVSLVSEPTADWKSLLDHDSYLIETMNVAVAGLTVVYTRGGQYTPEDKSPFFDEIGLQLNHHQSGSNQDRLMLLALVNKLLNPFDPARSLSSASSEVQAHQGTLERLELLNEDLIRGGTEFRKKLEEDHDARVKSNAALLNRKQEELEQIHQHRTAELALQKLALEEKLKHIDDRDNTHARRKIRDEMLDEVKQRVSKFGVSESTENKRRPVAIGMGALALAFVALLGWTAYEIYLMNQQYFSILEGMRNLSTWGIDKIKASGFSPEVIAKATAADADRTQLYWLWLRFALFSGFLVATILYYVKWQNRWADQHSSLEFQLRLFQLDVSRANWVLESCLEWQKETDSAVPGELLNSITRNLFVNSYAEPEQVIHPADELASALMGSSSKLKLSIGQNELEFDKPGKIPNKLRVTPNDTSPSKT
jgi:hypothetical protein